MRLTLVAALLAAAAATAPALALYSGGHGWQRPKDDERKSMAAQERDLLRTFLKAKPPH